MAGQPTKYDPKYCTDVVSFMADGSSLTAFAASIGVCKQTVYNWGESHPEFLDAIKRGQTACEAAWERQLRQAVIDRSINAVPVLFALKCRFGYKETTAHEVSGPDGKPIESKSLAQVPEEQLDARLAILLAKMKGGGEA